MWSETAFQPPQDSEMSFDGYFWTVRSWGVFKDEDVLGTRAVYLESNLLSDPHRKFNFLGKFLQY